MITNYASCNISPLDIFTPTAENPWDAIKVRHLHNRLGFGIETSQIPNALSMSPDAYVDSIIDAAIALPPTTEPAWAPLDPDDYAANGLVYGEDENEGYLNETQYTFIKELIDNGVRGRMILFWHNHFVTIANEYGFAGYAFRYFQDLQKNCFGNFRTFITEMGLDNAMLKFLNGFESTVESPNENYARELYELFALGEGNGYTEDDIVETSRALTGYNEYENGENSNIIFNEENFDAEDKTIFGQTGNWDYDDVINILFTEKTELIARYICEKLYTNFVSPEVDDETIRPNIINPLADIFIANNFDITPVLRTLFKSEHFFDEKARNTIIKSPLDLIIQFMVTTGFNFGGYDMIREPIKGILRIFDQDIMNPPTVFGWPGDRDWINSGTITFRPAFLFDDMLSWASEQGDEQFRQFAKDVSGNSTDADVVATAIFEALMNEVPYTLEDFETGIDVFKDSVPLNFFETNTWTLDIEVVPTQVCQLIKYIVFLPDYQLK